MADRRVSVNVDADVSPFVRGMMTASAAAKGFGTALKSNEPLLVQQSNTIDRYSGRLQLIAEGIATVGTAAIPLGAAVVPALAGLTSGLLAAGGAAGVAIGAFSGLGDAMDALDAFKDDRSAENLQALREEFEKIGPAGAHFVKYLDSIEPELKALQNTARAGFLPGVEQGIETFLTKAPQVQRIIENLSTEMGSLTARAGAGLAGDEFSDFFDYLETDAAPTLRAFAESIGNLAGGFGHLIVAFAPLSRDFSTGLESMTQSFENWAEGLSQTDGLREFVDYIRESGPQAMEFLGAISNALIGIVTAAAPFGSAVLPVLTSFANVLAAIAESPIGPPLFTAAAGFIAVNRAVSTFGPGLAKLNDAFLDLRTSPNVAASAAERFGGAMRGIAGAAGVGLFVTSLSETNDKLKAFEGIAGGALTGLAVGGPWGAAIGGAVGALTLFGDQNRENTGYVQALTASLDEQTGAFTANSRVVAAKVLEDQGLLKAAEGLGLNLDLVTSAALGNKDALAQINTELERFANVDTASGVDVEMFEQRKAGAELSKTLEDLAGDSDSTVSAQRRVAAASKGAATEFEKFTVSASKAESAARDTAKGFITLGGSLNDSKVSLNDWIRDMQEQATALRNFGANAQAAANKGLRQGLISALKEAGPEGALRMKQLANATKSEIAKANGAWASGQKAIRDYVNLEVPAKKVRVDTGQAFDAIAAMKFALKNIPDETVNISLIRKRGAIDVATTRASGGPIVGPGTKTSDDVPILASNGEFMMSAAAVDHYGLSTMYAMNARRLAGGGDVSGRRPSLDDRLAVAQALQSVRDLVRQLNDRVDKGKNKGNLVTTGLDRHVLELQLQAARIELRRAQNREQREAAIEFKQAARDARQGLDITGGLASPFQQTAGLQAIGETAQALMGFRDQILDAGGKVGKNFTLLAFGAAALTGKYADNAEKIADLTSQIDSLRTTAAGSFMHDALGGTLGDFDLQVSADTNDANSMIAALNAAAANGLDGPLAAALASSGNLTLAQDFAGLSAAEIEQREQAYGARQVAGDTLGNVAVQMSGLAEQVSTLAAENVKLAAQIRDTEQKIKAGVYEGAYDGTAQRERDRDQRVGGRVGAGR